MKTNIKNTLLLTTLITLSSQAIAQAPENVNWVKGPFWRAPHITEMSIKLKTTQASLERACAQFNEIIFAANGEQNWPGQSKRVDRFRKMPLPENSMNTLNFEAIFEVTNTQGRDSLIEESIDVSSSVEIDDSKETLPLYTQLKATTGASIQDIDTFKIRYLSGKQSLSKVSHELGLEESAITIGMGRSGNLLIKVEGRDVACDLLHGNIKITASAPSFVRLSKENVTELESFYHTKLSPQLNKILANASESIVLKSARLGFLMSKVLEEDLHQKDPEQIGRHIKNLIEVLFVPKTLQASANLVEINKKKVVDLKSMVDSEPVTLNLTF